VSDGELQDRSGVRVPPPLYYLAAIFAGVILQRLWPLPLVTPALAPMLRSIGIVLIVISLTLGGVAFGLFRRAGTSPNPMRPSSTIVDRGPYAFTRNPMYLGFSGIVAGIALIMNSAWMLVMVPLVMLVVTRQVILKEEAYLARKFGAPYVEYLERVRRWL
jgi:protein-S-isoprenylcysteine O-methyltransferase Ste14